MIRHRNLRRKYRGGDNCIVAGTAGDYAVIERRAWRYRIPTFVGAHKAREIFGPQFKCNIVDAAFWICEQQLRALFANIVDQWLQ